MAAAKDLNVPAVVVLGYGDQAKRYPVCLVSRGPRFAWVRFLVDCEELVVRSGDAQLVSVDVLEPRIPG